MLRSGDNLACRHGMWAAFTPFKPQVDVINQCAWPSASIVQGYVHPPQILGECNQDSSGNSCSDDSTRHVYFGRLSLPEATRRPRQHRLQPCSSSNLASNTALTSQTGKRSLDSNTLTESSPVVIFSQSISQCRPQQAMIYCMYRFAAAFLLKLRARHRLCSYRCHRDGERCAAQTHDGHRNVLHVSGS